MGNYTTFVRSSQVPKIIYGRNSDISEQDLSRLFEREHAKEIRLTKREAAAEAQKETRKRDAALSEFDQPGLRPPVAVEVPWSGPATEEEYQKVMKERQSFSTANEWKRYVEQWYPDLDAEEEKRRKLAENYCDRQYHCGTQTMRALNPDGTESIRLKTCGLPTCEFCRNWDAGLLLKALKEVEANCGRLLKIVVASRSERSKATRALRTQGIEYRTFAPDDGQSFEILFPETPKNLAGEHFANIYEVQLTDEETLRLVGTRLGERTSGSLIESKKGLRSRFRQRGEFEVQEPFEITSGQKALKDDVVELEIKAIATEQEFEWPAYDGQVADLDGLATALQAINDVVIEDLKKSNVAFDVYNIMFYTSKTTLPEMLAAFNRRNNKRAGKFTPIEENSENSLKNKLQNLRATPAAGYNFKQKLALGE